MGFSIIYNSQENETMRVVTDLRKLKVLLKSQLFPIPKIGKADMIRSMEGFSLVSALDLNMGYLKLNADVWEYTNKIA
jgi:hypothetical protein